MHTQREPVVCHVTTVHPVGDPRIFVKQSRSLAKSGFRVFVLFAGGATEFDWEHVTPVSLGPRMGSRFRRMLQGRNVVRELRKISPDIVHFHDPELLPVMLLLSFVGLSRARFVYDVHENYETTIRKTSFPWNKMCILYRNLVRLAENRMVLILAEDSYVDLFRHRHPVIHNYAAFSAIDEPSKRERKLVYVGAVSEGRGAFIMIDAFSMAGLRDWTLQIIGHPHEDTLFVKMRSYAAAKGVTDQVVISDYIPFPTAMRHVARARLGLCLLQPQPNSVESLPTKVFDYLSARVPVLLSDFPYYREIFGGIPGIHLVDPQNARAIASKLRILTDDANWSEVREDACRGRNRCVSDFNWQREAARLEQIYKSLLRTGNRDASLEPHAV